MSLDPLPVILLPGGPPAILAQSTAHLAVGHDLAERIAHCRGLVGYQDIVPVAAVDPLRSDRGRNRRNPHAEGRQDLIDGINVLADAVKSTLGARGQTVLIESENHTHVG